MVPIGWIGQVDDVETHVGHGVQPAGGVAQRSLRGGGGPLGSVGRTRTRSRRGLVGGQPAPATAHSGSPGRATDGGASPPGPSGRAPAAEPDSSGRSTLRRAAAGPGDQGFHLVRRHADGGPVQDPGALLQLQLDIHPSSNLDPGPMCPGAVRGPTRLRSRNPIRPRNPGGRWRANDRCSAPGRPSGSDRTGCRPDCDQVHRQGVVSLADDGGLDRDLLVHRALGGVVGGFTVGQTSMIGKRPESRSGTLRLVPDRRAQYFSAAAVGAPEPGGGFATTRH